MGLCAVLLRGGYLIDAGDLTIGQLTQCIFYVFLFLGPIADLSDLFERGADGVAAARRIFLLLDTEPSIKDQDKAQRHQGEGEIQFDGLSFAITTMVPVLQDISTTIKAGETVALVGATGHARVPWCNYWVDSTTPILA